MLQPDPRNTQWDRIVIAIMITVLKTVMALMPGSWVTEITFLGGKDIVFAEPAASVILNLLATFDEECRHYSKQLNFSHAGA